MTTLLTEFLKYTLIGMIGWIFVVGLFVTVCIFRAGHKAYKENKRRGKSK